MFPIEVRYHRAALRFSVPHQSTVPFASESSRHPDTLVGFKPAVPSFVSLLVHLFNVSGSSALFVGRFRTAMALLIPASASENAFWREPLCCASCAPDVE